MGDREGYMSGRNVLGNEWILIHPFPPLLLSAVCIIEHCCLSFTHAGDNLELN